MSAPWRPLAVAAGGIATYSLMDGLMKGLSIAMSAYSALFWRLAVGLALTAALYFAGRPAWPAARVVRIHAARSAVVACMALAFFWGIARVPLAEAIALSFVAPLLALGLARLFLHERVAARAVAGSLLALAGVGVILAGRLGTTGAEGTAPDVGAGMAAVLFSACAYAVNLVMARHQAQLARPLEIAFFQHLFVGGLLLLGAPWLLAWPVAGQWPAVAGSAGLAVVSLLLMSWANRRAEAQVLLSVEYTAFIWAAVMGWYAFDERLTPATLAGTVLIVAGCLAAARAGGGPASPEAEAAA